MHSPTHPRVGGIFVDRRQRGRSGSKRRIIDCRNAGTQRHRVGGIGIRGRTAGGGARQIGSGTVVTAPDESSIRRTVSCPGVPFQLAFGRNLTWSVDLSRNGAASVGAVGRSVQPLPLLNCHLPWAAVAALAHGDTSQRICRRTAAWVSVASLKIGPKIEFTVAPAGLPVSSGTLAKVTLAAVRNGASLTGVMLITTFLCRSCTTDTGVALIIHGNDQRLLIPRQRIQIGGWGGTSRSQVLC